MLPLPPDYRERVYAGVLGKIIGVYLGRPFEQWSHDRIESELGEIRDYVHEKVGHPLIVADDDISGTFTFIRALEDNGFDPNITAAQIGDTWLNYLIDKKTVLWWGGVGMSTEHTAYERLKAGIKAPASGSIATNGIIVAEQIGGQIFIDGWGLICPNEPELAADVARRAASVSHDGEGIYGGQVVAAMVAAAFSEPNVERLIDIGLAQIPEQSHIHEIAADIRRWNEEGLTWRGALKEIHGKWGYEQWAGGCHMLPNHAVILLALVYGGGDFDESMMIVNTAGYDTDCNSGNVGCILGVAGGLKPLQNWREPVADEMLIPTADGGRVVTDAVREADALSFAAHRMRGGDWTPPASRYHFELDGSLQAFRGKDGASLTNTGGKITLKGGDSAATPTWTVANSGGYRVTASPTLYPGQVIQGSLSGAGSVRGRLTVQAMTAAGGTEAYQSPLIDLSEKPTDIVWSPDVLPNSIICEVGFAAEGEGVASLHQLHWKGTPRLDLGKAPKEQWIDACDNFVDWPGSLTVMQNQGLGMALCGTREWKDYQIQVAIRTNLAEELGVAVRVMGLRRYIAVIASRSGKVRLVEQWDDETRVLAESPFAFDLPLETRVTVKAVGSAIEAWIGDIRLVGQTERATHGGVGLVAGEGTVKFPEIRIGP